MRGYKETSLFSCISSSLCIHGSVVAGAALIASTGLITIPEGTMASDRIEIEITAPKGQQTLSPKVGAVKIAALDVTHATSINVAPEPIVETETKTMKTETVVVKKKIKQPKKVSKKSKAKDLNGKLAAQLKKEKERQKQKELAHQEELKALQEKQKQQEALIAQMKKDALKKQEIANKQQQKKEADRKALLAKEAAEKKAMADNISALNSKIKKLESQKPKTLKVGRHELAYGVPSGMQDAKALKQYPGNVPPSYPRRARLEKRTGRVRLYYYVTKNGHVKNVRMAHSSGHSDLDRETLEKVSKYRYFTGQEGWTYHDTIFRIKGQSEKVGGRLRSM